MRIKEIELDNFKSFGRRTTIPLLEGFTTISGPNGSGKSNIIDSVLFALGLSSTRSMRAERLPDLLNNLSGKNEAKVTVRFHHDDGTEIEVTRRVRVKDNGYTSTYFLNGKNATLSEIHEELQKFNVSPTGFNVIMQGDVTGIVTMTPTERRKIIDELAGVADFDRRIEQANEELASVGEKIERQKIVLSEIVARLEQLREDRDQALKYLALKEQREKIERDLMFVRVNELKARADDELAEIEKLNQEEKRLLEELDAAEVELMTLRSEMVRIEQEIREKGGNEQLLLKQEADNKRGELTREENKYSNLSGVIAEKSKTQKNLEAQIKTIDRHLSGLTRQRKQNQEDLKAVQLALAEKQGAFSAVAAEIEVLRQEKNRSFDKASSLHDELQDLRDQRHKLEVRRTELSTRREGLDHELQSIRNSATEGIAKSAQLKGLISHMEHKLRDDQAIVVGAERSIRQLEGEIESTREEIEHKRQDLEALNRKVVQLETHREIAGESGYGRAVEAVLAAGINGVQGTIGQLGQVDGEYTTALEIAIGPRLAHVVVDDDQVAQECIEYLKRTGSGRATFVPLNKVIAQAPGLLPNKPGVIDFAYNLINFNPKYAKAFQYACGLTIVVDKLETGRRMINQARMVTLEGDLFEKSGTMAGGGDGRSKLHFSAKGETDINALKAKVRNEALDIKDLQHSINELTSLLKDERKKHADASKVLASKQSELDTKRRECQAVDKVIDDQKPRLKSNADEIERIDTEVVNIQDSLQSLEKQINKFQDELGDITGSGNRDELTRLIGESEELRADVENIEKSATDVQRELDRVETEERLELANKSGLANQLAEVSSELTELNAQCPAHEQAIAELKIAIAEVEKHIARISAELVQLQKSKDGIYEQITVVEVRKTKINQDIIHLTEDREDRKLAHFDLAREIEQLNVEIQAFLAEHPDYEPPSKGTVEQLKSQSERLERRMRALEPVNMKALEEYNTTEARRTELDEALSTLAKETEEIQQRISGYDELKRRTFMEAFEVTNKNFQEIFAELSHGHGRLELDNPENPFAGGLIIRAQPRDKKMQRIEALSGGEKSLTALAFVFAFQRYAPAPFYAFDEVDMMLDGANAERLSQMVRRESESAQFVVVSLRRPMIENADHAIGVTLRADGYSRVVGLKEVQLPEEQVVGA